MDEKFKNGELSKEELECFVNTDLLITELSNIKQDTTNNNNVVYERIVKSQKRDRATSLAYGLSVIQSMELYNIKNVMDEEDIDDELIYF